MGYLLLQCTLGLVFTLFCYQLSRILQQLVTVWTVGSQLHVHPSTRNAPTVTSTVYSKWNRTFTFRNDLTRLTSLLYAQQYLEFAVLESDFLVATHSSSSCCLGLNNNNASQTYYNNIFTEMSILGSFIAVLLWRCWKDSDKNNNKNVIQLRLLLTFSHVCLQSKTLLYLTFFMKAQKTDQPSRSFSRPWRYKALCYQWNSGG